ncbi:hypothetical protein [Shewanella sp. 10N.286.48.A6]|uniref:hypothetical protein n=1 Tax=Shewanella sp. 10N.286.48.A6 TaxID=1880833 RepID=UPI000C81E8DC|nr:hypothetical protein [Shewanella sp. 10N.286.48.A6]PMI03305.1 hypothetical protein BCU55_01330 [Shewanella sp. 10N.286.48.A6]
MRKIVCAALFPLMVVGCASSGKAVKEHNLINIFYAELPHEKAAGIVADMSTYCGSGIFDVEHNDLNSIGMSTIDLKNKNANHYYMHIEVEAADKNKSKLSVYHYLNTSVTRDMGKTIENWVVNGSRECIQGF